MPPKAPKAPKAPAEHNLELNHSDLATVKRKWPHKDGSIDYVHAVHLIQFLKPKERIHFVNELWRVLKPDGKAQIVVPHWCSSRAHGDLAFASPPVSESWFPHLNAEWRKANAPWGKSYKCDFDHTLGYSLHPAIVSRNQEYQQHAVTFWKETAQDIAATLVKRV